MEETADGGIAESKGLVINPEDMWCLILTNAEYPVPEDYTVTLKDVPGTDQTVDERIYEPLMKMLEAMKAEGLSPVVCSGYRTLDKQEKGFVVCEKRAFKGRSKCAGPSDTVYTRLG